jgi:hypothetical protein
MPQSGLTIPKVGPEIVSYYVIDCRLVLILKTTLVVLSHIIVTISPWASGRGHLAASQMGPTALFFLLSSIPSLGLALQGPPTPFWRRDSRNVPPEGYYDPNDYGGQMLTVSGIEY